MVGIFSTIKPQTMIKGTKETLPDIIAAIYAAIDKIAK